jgi:hypothetical protein
MTAFAEPGPAGRCGDELTAQDWPPPNRPAHGLTGRAVLRTLFPRVTRFNASPGKGREIP